MKKVRVARVLRETPEIVSFDLVAMDGQSLPAATAGSHIDVLMGFNSNQGNPPAVRQYSLCQGPDETDCFRIAVKREPLSRGGSQWMHDSVREGDELEIGEPRDNFPLSEEANFHVLVAGGIGITPMLSMAQHLHAKGVPFRLEYFVRSMEHAAFASALKDAPFRDYVRFHPGVGRDALEEFAYEQLGSPSSGNAHLYICGPAPFMELIERVTKTSWAEGTVHTEYFGAATGQQAGDGPFMVRLARSDQELLVPAGVPVVEVLEAAGVSVDTSCRQGACGTCLLNVLEGVPDHRDGFLLPHEKQEGRCMIACVSRSLSPVLVLDI